DQYSFAARGIPSVLVTTFLHDDYHKPSDEARRIDADKVARIARLVFLTAWQLASGTTPGWTAAGRAAIH
ncbi:MAG TPA: M28 family peptidase, partial [Longimicrobiales bacterium]|nr:M28 family peptidase [Longimicrobiales bacterium]